MKTKVHAQSEMPNVSVPVVSQTALAEAGVALTNQAVSDMEIREQAFKLYEERGRVDGYDLQDWFEAESILRERGKLAA
jgi:hypothetical protein